MRPVCTLILLLLVGCPAPKEKVMRGKLLQKMTWSEAERYLQPETVVVIPLGAAAKEHGLHLQLQNDLILAKYFRNRILEAADVVVAPTVNYGYYPAFLEYPGSISLRLETARDMIVDICRSLSGYGSRRFYVLNTGVSTLKALRPAAEILAADGILLKFTDLTLRDEIVESLREQEGGSHADEIETSMMLYIAPETVEMELATKDYNPAEGSLTRHRDRPGAYSPTGVYGDPTLATREKGRRIVEARVERILREIEQTRTEPLPEGARR